MTVVIGILPVIAGCAVNDLPTGGEGKSGGLTLPGVTFKTILQPRFVGAQNNGGGAVVATATVAQTWETFSLDDINGGDLQSGDPVFIHAGNGQLFQAMNGGGSTLNAASNNLLQWETFKIVKQGGTGAVKNGDVVGLQTWTGSWVSAQDGGGGPVFAYGGALGLWEQLTINGLPTTAAAPISPPSPGPTPGPAPAPTPTPTPGQPSRVADAHFRTQLLANFIGAQNNGGGAVIATASAAQTWETFTLLDVNGGSLQSGDSVFIQTGDGHFWQATNGGGSTLDATATAQTPAATFKIVKQSGSGDIKAGDAVGLQAGSGAWVSAQNGGGGPVFAYGGALGPWEGLVFSTGNSDIGGGGAPPTLPGGPTLPSGRGANVPFVEYEAETMATNGQQLGPTRTFTQPASEASGRRAVRLGGTGQFVQFTNNAASNSIVVRYSVPDGGPDFWASLSVYVNGTFRTKLWTTSRYSWTYGGDNDFNQPWQNDPGRGTPHHFWDEAHAMIGDIPVGATVMVRKDGDDNAGYYDVDLIDMEQVAPPLGQPGGYLSLTADCGATPNDNSDDSGAIQRCVDRARGEGRGLYIPPGVFNSNSRVISIAGVTVRGAGMWHSTIQGFNAHFDCWANNCQYYDLAVFGDTTQRIDTSPEAAFGGCCSQGVVLDHIWVEHTKVGYFTGPNANGMIIRNSRLRDLFADGVNLYGGTSNAVIENNHVRNSGDDAFAMWSHNANGQGPDTNNVFRHNTAQLPWKANCFALYGGRDNQITDNVCADVVQYPGILLSRQFDSVPFSGTTVIARNTLIRAGAWAYNQEQGALKIHADQADIGGVSVTDLDVQSPTYYAVHVQGMNGIFNVTLSNVTVSNPGSGVFFLNWGARGSMNVDHVTASGSPRGVRDDTGGAFSLIRGAGNSGW